MDSVFTSDTEQAACPMASVDHAWLRMDTPVNPMVINAVISFKQPLNTEDCIQQITSQLLSNKIFRSKPGSSIYGAQWQQTKVDESYHFSICHQRLKDDQALQAQATDFINQPLDHNRPLWRVLLVPHCKSGGALVVRIHHAYADGMALMKVLLKLMDERELIEYYEKQQTSKQKKPRKNRTVALFSKLQNYMPGNGKWLEALGLVDELTTELLKLGLSPGEENAFKKPGLCGKKQLVWTKPLNLDEVKTIAKFQHAKVNDVLLNSVSGAFRRYLKSIDQLSAWSEMKAVIPVDLRQHVNARELGNYFGLVFLSLPLGTEDPIERSRLLHKRMNALKDSKQAWLTFQLLQLAGYLPEIIEKELIQLFSSKGSMVMTNVPGPQFPLHLSGNEIDQIMFWVPQSGSIGIGVSILTYNNHVQFGLMTDKQIIPNPEKLIDFFTEEFESLLLETLMTVQWPSA
ncbi:WS/DGAT domain-containing protein [Reinekea marinisedimentorum]|uniref:diacylglycerol O-acyltransferase n=1 Tax=Reinekea marinisedimentorum TaxID=230495 RepID=A0A4R3IA15_9GAMM|nr:WS/DGAT domain-containing protein [Reinekea marinisedimentorum]TCS41984.1 WS/DGAT/MGAT family acyltransferase [Reinekea marinisedimentorum]